MALFGEGKVLRGFDCKREEWGALHTKDKKNVVFLSLVFFMGLVFLRGPEFLLQPRIWAEGGTIYLISAIENGWKSIFIPHLGYYSLFNNASSLLAVKFFPVELYAHVLTYSSLLAQMATLLLILYSDSIVIDNIKDRFLAAIGLVFFGTAEVWLNIINMQFWFAAGTIFLLTSRSLSTSHLAYLLVSFMTGVSSLFLAPFFLITYLMEKRKGFLNAFIIGIFGFFVQACSVIDYVSKGSGNRFSLDDFSNIYIAVESFAIPFFHFDYLSLSYWVALFLSISFVVASVFFLVKNGGVNYYVLVGGVVVYSALSIFASLGMRGGGRYALPVYFLIFVFIIIMSKHYLKRSGWFFVPLIIILIQYPEFVSTSRVYDESWPNWKEQVEDLEENEEKRIEIFPQWPNAKWGMVIEK